MPTTPTTANPFDAPSSPSARLLDDVGCADLRAFSHLVEAVVDLPTSEDPDAVYRRVAEGIAAYARWDTFSVLLLDDAGHLSFRWSDGHPDPAVRGWVFGSGQGAVGRAISGDSQLAAGGSDLLPSHGAELAVALPGRDRVLGVLALGRFAAHDHFTPREQVLVETVARHLGRAIESSCAHATTRRLARNLSLLQEAGRELTSILDRGELLERIAERLERLIDFQLFCVLLWDEDKQVLVEAFTRRGDEKGGVAQPPTELRLGEGLCGSAAALRQSIRVGDVSLDPRFLPCGDKKIRSALALPLIFEDRLLGVLDIESDRYDAFSPELEQMLLTLGSSIAVALANASLYEQLRFDERMLAKDLETARGVQRLLLPRSSPWTPGLQIGAASTASKHLGGDLYDFFPYGEGRFALALGDVAGKGTAAALYAALVLGILRGYVQQTRCSPACVMSHLNAELRQLDVERRFLAFTFAVYDSRRRQLELSNAGLPYPMLLRGGEVRELEAGGLPLGAMALDQAPRPELRISLQPGDVLLMASDGLEESRDPGGRAFGSERIAEVLLEHGGSSAEEIAHALLAATDDHAGTEGSSDDRTVLVIRVGD